MKRYWFIVGAMFALFLMLFLLVEALHIPILSDPSRWLERGGLWAALLGVALLIADIVLPVPSSLVMIAHGAIFGAMIGTLLSLIGSVGAAIAGFAIGRRGGSLLERLVPAEERARVDRLLIRWGALAIVVSRPVPLLAETVAIMSGASPMSWRRAILASIAGSFPPALLYALTGSVAASFESGALMFGFVVLVSGSFWLISRWVEPRLERG
ncbi:MAG TPA: VTT domain-containing protein [Blastocatellia bacterium]|nr:VTT domain-containing protein [Blastocatellia bacterium]